MKCTLGKLFAILFLFSIAHADDTADQLLKQSGISGGFIVHLGSGDGKTTSALRVSEAYLVHGLDSDAANVEKAREHIKKLGFYGPVFVEQFSGASLPYNEGIANLVVAENPGDISEEEIMRVLVPNGVALFKQADGSWRKVIKPRPDTIDDWSHYLHDAGGNAVADDDEVAPPRNLKWVGSPRWSRHHDRMASMSALVTEGGRVFYIMDEGSRISIQMPPKWKIVARDAFNGVILWKRDIPNWHNHLWPLKSGPTQLARRLVALDGKVFTTLGIKAPVTIMSAATGETLHTLAGSEGTEELIVKDGTVYLMAMKDQAALDDFLPQLNTGDQGRVAARYKWNEIPRVVMAFDVATGKEKWKMVSKVAPLTLTADGERVFFHDGEKVMCLSGESGEEVWTGPPADRRDQVTFNFGPKMVVYKDLVLFAGGDRKVHTYEAATGKELWNASHARGGYQSPEDLLVIGERVWSAPLTSGKDSGVFIGRNVRTGEVETEFAPDVDPYWFHHRCYIAKATKNFLMPSRTGIEFVDFEKKTWEINHWVRGGCLYGVMPANGLTYAPPHNCACYPETKLYGFNALSSTGLRPSKGIPTERLTKGPAFGKVETTPETDTDWPTFRGNQARSGFTKGHVSSDLTTSWENKLGGRLSSVVVSGGKLFVSQIDEHTVHALDGKTGEKVWSFTASGRVDSPPTVFNGAVFFGSADGRVYAVRAADGVLIWKFRAVPEDRRLMSFEQLESVWPIHGNVLIQDGVIYFVAGRSNFLDGGLRMIRMEPDSGKVIGETIIDEKDPETGKNLQDRHQVLQMPVGLPDILTCDNGYVYMRSQQFDLDGNRLDLGPHSGDAAVQGSVQKGGEHLFAPMSFLDDTWFHRSYWVFGKSFAGGHNGYYQAGKFTPSGRILVFNDKDVYGFGRKPQYLKWTTTIEHQLFAASKEAPDLPKSSVGSKGKRRVAGNLERGMIHFAQTKSLNPAGQEIIVEAWVNPSKPNGVILARGGPADGYALVLQGGKPAFLLRAGSQLSKAVGKDPVQSGKWSHLVGTVNKSKELRVFVNGKLAGKGRATALLKVDPKQDLEIGGDAAGGVGAYKSPALFTGRIDEVSIFHGTMTDSEILERFEKGPNESSPLTGATSVLASNFDARTGMDHSGKGNHGVLAAGVSAIEIGRWGGAMKFDGRAGKQKKGGKKATASIVKPHWTKDIPLLARAMVLADRTIFTAGPPDLIDEEETFKKLTEGDKEVEKLLAKQDAALDGKQGGILWITSADSGDKLNEIQLPALPVWDGMVAADGRIFLSTTDGRVISLSEKK